MRPLDRPFPLTFRVVPGLSRRCRRLLLLTLTLLLPIAAGWWPSSAWGIERDVVVSVYQGECREGDFAANLATAREVVREALARGSDFLALPECFLSGYESAEAVQRGRRSLADPDLQQFIAESASHDMVVLVGLARQDGDELYNTELVIYRGKLLGQFDKVMLTGGDSSTLGFTPGTAVPVFEAHGVRFATIICHDSSFPYVALAARLQGAELLFSPHNNAITATVADDHQQWVRNCHVGLACQLKMVVARANIVASDRAGEVAYGDSFILSPQGTELAAAKLYRNELVTATITPAMFRFPWVWADLNETPAWLRTQLGELLTDFRRPTSADDLRAWLENMVVYHRFTPDEVSAATGLTCQEVAAAIQAYALAGRRPPARAAGDPLRLLPYPGGRHPRSGFFEGQVMPQRETKFSVFTPWDDASYVVMDLPEAIFTNLGLTYLGHTHIPTIWDRQGITLPRLEWQQRPGGGLESQRTLPNGIVFGAQVRPTPEAVRMELWLRNGTDETLSQMRVQNCVMLAAADGFGEHTTSRHVYQPPYAAVRAADAPRWVITAWDPVLRCWGNDRCPCLHSDPQFPDAAPGDTVRARGWLSFYEGDEIEAEFARIEATNWRHD